MKLLATLVLVLATTCFTSATQTISRYFEHDHLSIYLEYNDGNHRNGGKLDWHYQGLSQQLNDYVEDRIKTGRFQDKKYEFSLWLFPVSLADGCPIEMDATEDGFKIFIIDEELSLEEMVRIIDFCATPIWAPFDCKEGKTASGEVPADLTARMKKVLPVVDLSFFKDRKTVVFEMEELEVYFQEDRLHATIDQQLLEVDINIKVVFLKPQKFEGLYFLGSDDYLYVYEGHTLRSRFERPEPSSRFAIMNLEGDEMHYYHGFDLMVKYSIPGNKFQTVQP